MKDLVLLVADNNARFALEGALKRPEALGIAPIEFEFRVHPGRDGGTRKSGPEALFLQRRQFKHALLVLDFEGSGTALSNAEELEAELDSKLRSLWGDAAKSIVVEPEVDAWVWGSDNAIEEIIGWPPGKRLREWLHEKGYEFDSHGKPVRPKEAFDAALLLLGTSRSSALYKQVTGKISLRRCTDTAFLRLQNQLRKWFPR